MYTVTVYCEILAKQSVAQQSIIDTKKGGHTCMQSQDTGHVLVM